MDSNITSKPYTDNKQFDYRGYTIIDMRDTVDLGTSSWDDGK
jgi:hypothetical protein